MKSLLLHWVLVSILAAPCVKAAEYKAMPSNNVWSPDRSFVIEQRWRSEDGQEDSPYWWQTWIVPSRKHQKPYQLKLWHDGEVNWAGKYFISPDGKWILDIQKTGSGDNYGAIFKQRKSGRFTLAQDVEPALSLSERAFRYFDLHRGLESKLYHRGVELISWGEDHQCVEISLHGSDIEEKYYIRDWCVHYNCQTDRFFLTKDQIVHNKNAIVQKH